MVPKKNDDDVHTKKKESTKDSLVNRLVVVVVRDVDDWTNTDYCCCLVNDGRCLPVSVGLETKIQNSPLVIPHANHGES